MSVEVTLHTDEAGQLFALAAGQPLAGPTPLAALPALPALQAGPYDEGRALAAALGGEQLLALLDADPDGLLLLACDAKAEAVPWEFAALPGRQLLACRYGLLRLVDRDAPPPGNGGELQFVALAADPLVDEQGRPREGYRLKLEDELRAIRSTLQDGDKALRGFRIAPTQDALLEALERGPAVLHLACHGNVVVTSDAGEMAVLLLEDADGGPDPLPGRDLITMPSQGVLRLVVLSACRTSEGQANLARALVLGGIPAAIGMQGLFPDDLSDELAANLYRTLLGGYPLGEALRRARLAMRRRPDVAGLPVGYAARGGWAPLPLAGGRPEVRRLGLPGDCSLPQEVQPPRPILGRNGELHALARLYSRGAKVVTVVGTGGVGKTALAATFAERFAWRWPRGVLGLSFAGGEVDAARFRGDLLRGLLGEQAALGLAAAGPGAQAQAILAALRDWDGLLLLDNYESVLQALAAGTRDAGAEAGPPAAEEIDLAAMRALLRAAFVDDRGLRRLCQETPALQGALPAFGSGFSLDDAIDALLAHCRTRALVPELLAAVRKANPAQYARHFPGAARGAAADEAAGVHRLVYQVAEGGARLLLTSREHPAGLPGEVVFPAQATPLPGLRTDPAAELFLKNSTRAGEQGPAGRRLAADIARETEGHPLAIALLAGEYDRSPVAAEAFLARWPDELAAARREGLAGHHVTFAAAFNRSYDALPPALQARLRALSVYPFPFLAQGAAAVWGLEMDEGGLAAAREDLGRLARANLLEVEGWFKDGTPATYRFQPALHQAVARRATDEERAGHLAGYAAYGAWLARRGYGAIHRDMNLARLVRLSLDALDAATGSLAGIEQLWHVRRLAWLKRAYGETGAAYGLLEGAVAPAPDPEQDPEGAEVQSALRYELAKLCVTRGDLDRALALFRESLQIDELLGDEQGKAASLHEMAAVYLTRGDLDRALALYQESLTLLEQLGDKQSKAASLHQMAQVYLTRGDLDRALALYQESLQISEQLGDKQGKGDTLHQMARIYLTRGDLDRALALYRESLALLEQLGDKQGKAASLANLAQVYLTRGDLDRALALYQESLLVAEQLGDKQGKAASLHNMANIFMARGEWVEAERALQDSLRLAQAVGSVQHVAFATTKLGQVAEARGDGRTALAHYREALALFEHLGMPEAQQVREMIAHLEGGGAPADDPLGQAIARARAAADRGDVASAVAAQEQAVALVRQAGEGRDVLVALSVLLYNLAGYYRDAGRFDDAVRALEEVVALDERTGHQDLESDRQALAETRRLAAWPPGERERPQGGPPPGAMPIPIGALPPALRHELQPLATQLERAGPEERAALEGRIQAAVARGLEAMSPEERANLQAAAQAAARRDQIQSLADQARDRAIAALRGEVEPGPLAQQLEEVAAQAADGEEPGSPWDELAGYLRAVAALLRGEPAPPVPAAYAAHLAAVQAERR